MCRIYCYLFFIVVFLFPHPSFGSTNPPSTTTLTLDKAVHFIATDGNEVFLQPGTYIIEAAEEWLRLIPGERRNTLLLQARRTQHHENLETAIAVSQFDEPDEYQIALLLPGGEGLEAIGSVSGVRSRATRRPQAAQTRTPKQASRVPTQLKKSAINKQSHRRTTSVAQPKNPMAHRIQTLEQQVNSLQTLVNTLQSQLHTIASAIQVDNTGNITIDLAGKFKINATIVDINASSIKANAGLSKFSGVVQADSVVTNSVVSSTYTPGAGNIW